MIKKLLKKSNSVLWIIAVLLILVPLISKSTYFQDIAVLTFLWAGLASSWNLYCGYCKRTSIGHAAFMGIGAYTSTLLYLRSFPVDWYACGCGDIYDVCPDPWRCDPAT